MIPWSELYSATSTGQKITKAASARKTWMGSYKKLKKTTHAVSSPVQSWQTAIAHPPHTRAAQHAGHKPPCLCPRAGPLAAEGLLDPALPCRLPSAGLVPLQDQSFENFGRMPAAKQTVAAAKQSI